MRLVFLLAAYCVLLTAAHGAGAPRPEVLASWHFAGTASLRGDTNGMRLRAVLARPSTVALIDGALEGLSRSPRVLFSAAPERTATAALRPLLDDLMQAEWYGEARSHEWAIAVRLAPEVATRWMGAWQPLLSSWGATCSKQAEGSEARWGNPSAVARIGRVGDWTVVGAGTGELAAYRDLANRVKSAAPGVAGGAWLEGELNLPGLAPVLGLPAGVVWPQARVVLAGRAANVRTQVELSYREPLNLRLDPWSIPTNAIHEPLVSFAAIRGVRSWVAAQPWFRSLEGAPAPNQVFGWSQSQVPYQVYAGWKWPDATNLLQRLRPALGPLVTNALPELRLGALTNVVYEPALDRVSWLHLPLLVPFIAASSEASGFVEAGVFPVKSTRPTAPPQLFAEVQGRTNLVYYHWEITNNRLASWNQLLTFHDMLAEYVPPSTNSLALRWIQDTNVTSNLGNCVTEVTMVSPRELSLTRTSAVGFTGYELNHLVGWLGDAAFPRRTPSQTITEVLRKRAASTAPPAPAVPTNPAAARPRR